jgi:hypothetical protein
VNSRLKINLRKLKLRKKLKEIKAIARDKLFRIKERKLLVVRDRLELAKKREQDSKKGFFKGF